jgi:hypothetical protein
MPDVNGIMSNIWTMVAIIGGGVILLTIVITLVARRTVRRAFGPDRTTLEQGIPARAKIVGLRQTGVMVNYQPQVAFQLEVHPPDGTVYHAEAKAVVPIVNIPQLQPGVEVPVKIHPTDPSKVVLDLYG